MRLYCVRHGESTGNRDKFHQIPEEPLTDIGQDQARYLAHRFTTIPIDVILTSDYRRTLETAEIIHEHICKPVEVLPILQEMKKPSALWGKQYGTPPTLGYYADLEVHKLDPAWHYSDEENYFDVFQRTVTFLHQLEARPENHVLVVSHGIFLHMFYAMMMYPDHLDLPFFERHFEFSHLKNTGITIYERKPDKDWQMLTWNDYAHLE